MASEIPIVRNIQSCLAVEMEPSGSGVTLRTLVHAIVRIPGEPFPCIREEMAIYALLTNGRGEHDFSIELSYFDMGLETTFSQLGPLRIDLGQDPLAVLGLPIPLRNVIFPLEGQYTIYLACEGQPLADVKLLVR